MAYSREELEALAKEAGLSPRTVKKLEGARAKLAGETPSTGASSQAKGHGASAQNTTPLVGI